MCGAASLIWYRRLEGRNAPAFTDDAGSCLLVRASYLPCRWSLPVSWPMHAVCRYPGTLNSIHSLQSVIPTLPHSSPRPWFFLVPSRHLVPDYLVSSLVHVFRLISSLCVRASQQRLCKQQNGRAVPHQQTCSCIIIMTGVQPARSSQECRQTVSSPWLALPFVSPCLSLPCLVVPRLALPWPSPFLQTRSVSSSVLLFDIGGAPHRSKTDPVARQTETKNSMQVCVVSHGPPLD